jgi:hypothetical protein
MDKPLDLGASTPPRAGLHLVVVAATEGDSTRITQDSGMGLDLPALHTAVVAPPSEE